MESSTRMSARAIAPSNRVDNKPATSGSVYPDVVIVARQATRDDDLAEDCSEYVRTGERYGLRVKLVKLDGLNEHQMFDLLNELPLGPETEVVVNLHGRMASNGLHQVANGDTRVYTQDLITALRNKPDGPWKGRIHIASCEAGVLRSSLNADGSLWGAGECIVYASTALEAVPRDDVREMIRLLGECKKHDEQLTSTLLMRHFADTNIESISLIGGDREKALILHSPKVPTDLLPGVWQASIDDDRLQRWPGATPKPRLQGPTGDVQRVLATDRTPASLSTPPNEHTRLHMMALVRATRGDEARLTEVLKDSRLDERDRYLCLRDAVHLHRTDHLRMLVRAGLSVGLPCPSDQPMLLSAATNERDFEMVECLCKLGAPVSAAGKRSPLHDACAMGELDIARVLLEHGADVNLKDPDGNVPLYEACVSGNMDLVELLVTKGAEIELTAEGVVSRIGLSDEYPLEEVMEILQSYAETEVVPQRLLGCIARGDVDGVWEALSMDPKLINTVDPSGRELLQLACEQRDPDMMKAIVDAGFSPDRPNSDGFNRLSHAILDADEEMVKWLVALGANVNSRVEPGRRTLLHVVCQVGDPQASLAIAEILIDAGADVNAIGVANETVLASAKRRGKNELAALLVEKGAK